MELPQDRIARIKREKEEYEAHKDEYEKFYLLPVEKMYEMPGTPKFLSVSDTWKINSTLPFYNITTFHLYMKIEAKRPVKKFWLSWCFQKPMAEKDMKICGVPGSDPAFCKMK